MAASRPDSAILLLSRRVDWLQSFASDSDLMARALGRLSGAVDSSVSFASGQLPSLAEFKEVRRLSCGALDLEFDAQEEVATSCTLSATSDRWQAFKHGIRSRRRAVMTSAGLIFDTIRA